MHLSYKDTIIAILAITKYPNDKESFAKRFEEQNGREAVHNSIEKLPYDVQEQIKACNNDPVKIQQLIPLGLYKEELKAVYMNALLEFVESLKPSLTEMQKEQIAELFPPQSGPIEIFSLLSL